jgi:hypothetical protein
VYIAKKIWKAKMGIWDETNVSWLKTWNKEIKKRCFMEDINFMVYWK